MDKDQLLNNYPTKDFVDKFAEKEKAMLALNVPKEQIENKKLQYEKIFEYNDLLRTLRELLKVASKKIPRHIFDQVQFHFNKLKNLASQLDNLNFSNPNDINSIFVNFDSYISNSLKLNQPINYNGVDLGKTVIDEYIHQVREIINELQDKKIDKKVEQINEALQIANKIISNKDRYKKALQIAERWIQTENKAIATSLSNKALIFEGKLGEYKLGWWLAASIVSGFIAIGSIAYFIFTSGNDLSFGASILRISMVIIISYFTFFFLSQFSNNKKLYEAYKFKATALEVMEELIKSYSDHDERTKILNKAVDIIFNEPVLKDLTTSQNLENFLGHLLKNENIKRK